MRELIACWQHTRMIVLIALCAALFVALLIPFKIAVIIPGITEVRPAAALPVLFSLFFGPAAAWGAAFGNTMGDFFGTISPGTFFGFFGNFVYGFVPYRVMRTYLNPEDKILSVKGWPALIFSIVLASGLCATIIALGVDALGMVPFPFLVTTIFLNNMLMSIILVPLLAGLLFKRVEQMKLTWIQIMKPDQTSSPLLGGASPVIVLVLLLVLVAAGMGWIPLFVHKKIVELIASIVLTLAAIVLL
jgi:energy-coupling factor transport system substrate-specific component